MNTCVNYCIYLEIPGELPLQIWFGTAIQTKCK